MELKHVIPDVEKTFGRLEFAGEGKITTQRINGQTEIISRGYKVYSDIQRADDLEIILPAHVGEKNIPYMAPVKLIHPKITAEGYKIGNRGFVNYVCHADDLILANK
ncbi:YdcP family protein [Vagococcus acidifermentans]|uniref:Conjugal transfer protein n=1 Tax=Vagococcus acidifermentans TaxID=564710 RepID=A0A430ANW8_9ENTE|nr:YdcP family protein [Vagococcus acidifermentans]RSU09811.1 conjugal transfer protein [Vagococcus acidifermentans]